MKHKNMIIILIAVLVIVLLAVWIGGQTGHQAVSQPRSADSITDSNTLVLESVVLDTDKDVYAPGENVTALVLLKNEFDSEKTWELIAGVKDSGPEYLAYRSQPVGLAPGEIKRQDMEINLGKKKLTPGQYRLELSVRENNQEISLKSSVFEVR